jgi:1-acyl-sn-glycerol-3-phosphate acyltransferase
MKTNNWLHHLIRFIIFSLVRLFYPQIEMQGRENLPTGGPVIFVLNHPNGLMDPIMLMLGLKQPVSFWAKSTLFGNPLGRVFMEAFGALPIYRRRDNSLAGGSQHGETKDRNEETFARCRTLLRQGGAIALFPEGTTHSGAQLLQLRTGAARVALSAEAEAEWRLGLQIVPVGLWYQSKIHFRTSVLLVIGRPFDLAGYAVDYGADETQTVRKVTDRIEVGLDPVVLQAENAELLAALPIFAAWVAPEGEALTLPQQHAWAARLLAAYERLQQTDPAGLEAISQQAWRYAHALQTLGIKNPWSLELPAANRRRLSRLILKLILTFPLALAGFLLSYGPYRLAGPIATTLVGPHDTQTSTFKLIGGSFLVLLGWVVEAVVCGFWLGPLWGVCLFLAAPPLAYIALRWGEDKARLQEIASYQWLRLRREELVQALIDQRRILARQVMAAIQVVSV